MTYQQGTIWDKLAGSPDHRSERNGLVAAYESFHAVAVQMADEIRVTMPSLTEHGGPHLDALWEMADLIAGPTYDLTPAEVFVFGGAVLLHDLGLGVAAYPEGIDSLRQDAGWSDAIALVISRRAGGFPSRAEIDAASQEVQDEALATLLRQRHAEQAKILGTTAWALGGEQLYMIESTDLRHSYGRIIGQIAASHWVDLEELTSALPQMLGAMPGLPPNWIVRPIRLAALLRTADYAHLDRRRAPLWLMAVRRPTGISRRHWTFQSKLNTPYPQGDQIALHVRDRVFPPRCPSLVALL